MTHSESRHNAAGARPRVLALVGPTASGKSAIAMVLAEMLDGEIISADSRQVYRFLNIGTAKPSVEDRRRIPHHFIDELTPDRDFDAGAFGVEARKRITEILDRKRSPIVVGGSGLYVQSLIDGFFEGPGADKAFRSRLEAMVEEGNVGELISQLAAVDPETAATADPSKPRRIIRALEVFHLTGQPLSHHHSNRPVVIPFTPVLFGLAWERRVLYERINARCESMLHEGLLDEVDRLAGLGYTPLLNALNTVGYAEAFAFRQGEITYEEMVRLFKQNSRRYAKRQLTWFRRDP
ncbi:MAG: tRNA (adenosine(37)-N6)-dimethylallyltransferase MiaA, partial [Ignavibacteria bacterium]|nr:tRNA (adenosine(37)-N6)-dimethylallyltransferase MiaA [Ignavibacteria bacterium]